jgi:hypothetical protein
MEYTGLCIYLYTAVVWSLWLKSAQILIYEVKHPLSLLLGA